ncbi:alkaline phosphatase D family protein [Paracoccus onubensis]|uniref:alkaline phosphatase D family protein n=1 Tax=Paracoccus onubensis TaxID=1675788 RepID=UPI002732023A|nr:alkaline phosphatase D family protein [Paracoccus onubensis]MDP0928764.1 alkaline phosphatase D family protein [Paracoccus onubensis]
MTAEFEGSMGPVLYFRGFSRGRMRLAALVIRPISEGAPAILKAAGVKVKPVLLCELAGFAAWRFDFSIGSEDGGYDYDDRFHAVEVDVTSDMRIAFVSCNGEEEGDLGRTPSERNAMWRRLGDLHEESAFSLMLQGGDQIYADEVTRGHKLTDDWPDHAPRHASPAELEDLRQFLRKGFARRYLSVMSAPEFLRLASSVPVLSVWDDHDICDGWGSLKENRMNSGVGQTLFRAAREMYLLFQHAATEADIPELFMDPKGRSLGWCHHLPDLTVIAPDLRSERTRHRIMGPEGWHGLRQVSPQGGQVLMVSSVPLLGPRLSLVEAVMMAIPRMQHYEDDLRDQWQSRAHREEWRDMLREVLRLRRNSPVTAISGEIHLATRAEMGVGENRIHQLVASGISHRAPSKGYARGLGWLAGLGEAPLPEHPIRILPLPGQRQRYMAERNFLVLERQNTRWHAIWHLEESGATPPLPLTTDA